MRVHGAGGDVKAEQVMVLCDGALVDGPDIFPAIYKYQSGDCIMREVLASYCSRLWSRRWPFWGQGPGSRNIFPCEPVL